jgi:AraC family transcriptional regulator of adaptative response/methylated-DNA-[protein]-cysteine methyltransferase
MQPFADDQAKWDAVQRRDREADGRFLYSVLTTGVYCRPSCASRPKRRENVAFYPTAEAAERAGYRPCKRCRPDLAPRETREAAIAAAACRTIEAAEEMPRLDVLAGEAGISPHHFHRMFKRVVGVTPGAYAAQCRQGRTQAALGARATVTEAAYEAGFNSSGRFYESAGAMLGMTPTAWKKGGAGETMWHAIGESTLGKVLVAATAKGICAIMIDDNARTLTAALKSRFPKADHVAAAPEFARSVAAVVRLVDDPRRGLDLPLDVRGTAFQRRVWEELRKVPAGATVTYAELAKRVGAERAVRAVGTACGANHLAVAIPCHRALGTDGKLHGYRWGLERKKKLLARERG